jgi:hypothetical protein
MRKRILGIVLLAVACFAGVAAPAAANPVTYSPSSKTVAGTLPVTQTYTVAITSPSALNGSGLAVLSAGLVVPVTVSVTDFPDGSSAAAALALVSVSPAWVTFSTLSETHNVTVTITAAAGTPSGDYAYTIQANPVVSVPSWGNGGTTLSLELTTPVVTDTTPPNVTITSPVNAQAFAFCSAGNAIPVAIDAVDPESFVTAVNATVNGSAVALSSFTPANNVSVSGTYSATDIGSYTVSATATSAGGTSAPKTATFTVNYTLTFLPPLSLGKTAKGGSTIPIKFSARDCTGAFVADERVSVKVYEGTTLVFTAVFGEGSDSVRIDPVAEQYITNFQTSAGAHTYTAKVLFNGFEQQSINFSVR